MICQLTRSQPEKTESRDFDWKSERNGSEGNYYTNCPFSLQFKTPKIHEKISFSWKKQNQFSYTFRRDA